MTHRPDRTELTELDSFLHLFDPYKKQLHDFSGREGEYGHRFALLFRQVLRLLVVPSEISASMPKMFVEVAIRYLNNDKETVCHFSHEDNRHFFLSDLYDWLRIQERGRKLKQSAGTRS